MTQHHYNSESAHSYFKRLPLYLGIFLLTLIPFRAAELPEFDPDDFTISEFLAAQTEPRTGRWMVYLSEYGYIYFGQVERVETDHVWLRYKDRGVWCPYTTGVWVDYNQLLSVVQERSRIERIPGEGLMNLIRLT